MKDFKAISHTVGNEIKQKIFGKSNYGNDDWKKADFEWYEKIHNENTQLHENFMEFLETKRKSIETIFYLFPNKYQER